MGNSDNRKRFAKLLCVQLWEENVPSTFVCGRCTQRSACSDCVWQLTTTCHLCRFEGSPHSPSSTTQRTRQRYPRPTTPNSRRKLRSQMKTNKIPDGEFKYKKACYKAALCWEENVPNTFVCGQCTQRSACINMAPTNHVSI